MEGFAERLQSLIGEMSVSAFARKALQALGKSFHPTLSYSAIRTKVRIMPLPIIALPAT